MNTKELTDGSASRRRLPAWLPVVIVAVILFASVATQAPGELPFRCCLVYNTFGIPCPGCGMTRGFVAMGHGQFTEAWRSNPLSPILFVGAWVYLLYATLRCRLGHRWYPRRLTIRARRAAYVLCFAAVVGSWTLSLTRHFSHPLAGPRPLVVCLYERVTAIQEGP